MINRLLFSFLFSLIGTGCSSLGDLSIKAISRGDLHKHLVYIDGSGDLLSPTTGEKVLKEDVNAVGCQHLPIFEQSSRLSGVERRRWDDRKLQQDKECAYIQAILSNFISEKRRNPDIQLTLHIHGGLNTFGGVVERAQVLSHYMLADDHYPILIGWPSGFARSYWDHLLKSDRGRQRNNTLTTFFGVMTVVEDVARSVVRIPTALVRQADNALTVPLWRTTSEESDVENRGAHNRLHDAGFTIISEKPYTGVGGTYFPSIVNPVGWIATPLRDGLGSGAWDSMLRQTELVLTKASVYEGSPLPRHPLQGGAPELTRHPGDTALTLLLLELQRNEETKNVPINIIGHSMGAIVALKILSRHPGVNFRNVVFMAAAAKIRDVESIVVPWLATHPTAKFYSLSIDPYNEIAERTYMDFVPRGSLLMWIDDTFGSVNSFRDRTVGKWWNVVRIAEDLFPKTYAIGLDPESSFIEKPWALHRVNIRDRVVLKRFPIELDGSLGPQTHGDFNRYCFWRNEFWDSDIPARPLFEDGAFGMGARNYENSCASRVGKFDKPLTPGYRPKEPDESSQSSDHQIRQGSSPSE